MMCHSDEQRELDTFSLCVVGVLALSCLIQVIKKCKT